MNMSDHRAQILSKNTISINPSQRHSFTSPPQLRRGWGRLENEQLKSIITDMKYKLLILLTLSFLLTSPAFAVMKVPAPNNPLQPMPVGIKGNFSGNINSTSTSIAPLSNFSDQREPNASAINSQKIQNTENNSWYWLVLFVLLIIVGLIWGFRKLNFIHHRVDRSNHR